KLFVGKLSATQTVTFAHYGGRTSSNELRLLERDAARIADLEHKSWPEKQLKKTDRFRRSDLSLAARCWRTLCRRIARLSKKDSDHFIHRNARIQSDTRFP